MKKVLLSFIVIATLLAGCTQRIVDFTVISTKNVDMSKASTFTRGKSRVEGKDVAYIILFIPTGIPNVKEAIDKALESVPGSVALVDGVLSSKMAYFILGGMTGYVVEGTPLIDPSLADVSQMESNYMVCTMNVEGNVESFKYVTEEEYNALSIRK
ncbi:MAG: hypothetical protein JXB49_07575 [Bacteroidales bacterium]|nr:hypothetical protein [Bacteroidales bacterium]